MKNEKIIYYKDELNEEFSTAKIEPRKIDENYKYIHKNIIWNTCAFLVQNVLSIPIKYLYAKIKFRVKYIGKEKLKPYKKQGYFIYGNHTQAFADTFLISNIKGMKNFLEAVEKRIKQGHSITIFPEAHIWPYYTKIRPFKSVSFKYPIQLKTPSFCVTNTYQSYGKNNDKVKIVSYIDGPFFPDEGLTLKEQQENLRNKIYNQMVERSKNSNIEVIKYEKKEKRD